MSDYTPNSTKPIMPALADFLALLPEAISVLFSKSEIHNWGDQFRYWCLYRVEKSNGEIIVEWLVDSEFKAARSGLDSAGFVQDLSWETTPLTTRFVRSIP